MPAVQSGQGGTLGNHCPKSKSACFVTNSSGSSVSEGHDYVTYLNLNRNHFGHCPAADNRGQTRRLLAGLDECRADFLTERVFLVTRFSPYAKGLQFETLKKVECRKLAAENPENQPLVPSSRRRHAIRKHCSGPSFKRQRRNLSKDEHLPLLWRSKPSHQYPHPNLQHASTTLCGRNQLQVPMSLHYSILHSLPRFLNPTFSPHVQLLTRV